MDASRRPCRSHVLTRTLCACSIATARASESTHSRIRPTWDSSRSCHGNGIIRSGSVVNLPFCSFSSATSCRVVRSREIGSVSCASLAMREKVNAQTLGRITRRQLADLGTKCLWAPRIPPRQPPLTQPPCPCSSSVISSDIPFSDAGAFDHG